MAAGDPPPNGRRSLRREVGRIAAILLFWGGLALVGRYGVGSLAAPGEFLSEFGDSLALLFALAGLINLLIYVAARVATRARR